MSPLLAAQVAFKSFIGILLLVITISLAPSTLAQSLSTPSSSLNPNYVPSANSYVPATSPNIATKAIYDFGHGLSCIMIGQSPLAPCLEYRLLKNAEGGVKSIPVLTNVNTSNGVLGLTLSTVEQVAFTSPISSSEFIADLKNQIGLPTANAQVSGSGSSVLSPVFKLWEVSRNLAYLAMILIFVSVGLMVMFRQKLNPQTVVTVQLALPGLVIGLIMITFSYFFASLISDLAFVGTNLVGYYFSLAQGSTTLTNPPLISSTGQEENVLTIFSRFVGIIGFSDVFNALSAVTGNLNVQAQLVMRLFTAFMTAQFILPMAGAIPPPWGLFATPAITILTGVIGAITPETVFAMVIFFVAVFVLMYSMFKLLFKLVSNLLNIIFLTIISPFVFLIAALPGRQGMATAWLMNMLCYVLAFPAVIAVFYFVAFILKGVHPDIVYEPFMMSASTGITGSGSFPLLGGINLSILNLLIAFAALVGSPSVPDIICKSIGKLGPAGQMFGGEVQGDIRAGQGYYNQQQGAAKQLTSSTKRSLWGDSGFRHDGNGFSYGQTAPGALRNNIDKLGAGWRFWRWKVK